MSDSFLRTSSAQRSSFPPDIDMTRPSVARIYDAALGARTTSAPTVRRWPR
ncbi:hypothetical protein HDA32_005834 [Spinactinospora alkalitolerans]|uniref:Uncharacterized protein n=1 Tax=Spinactinospora alkalitolerans TaxID=687207 RepID=A0A852U9C3_9ACTN|nr:hypothetical protein [Spinactinospora alkalitolerans]NYE50714.1 hypothetical protein [Spinactinospora alkalitolerans]